MRLVVVSGLSGSGKSIALHTLEDLGYYCIDNLPVKLLERFVEELVAAREPRYQRSAVGIDARNESGDLSKVPRLSKNLSSHGIDCEIVFLDADESTLIKRFSETRRKHPLTRQDLSLADAIRIERSLLEPLANAASLRVDTSCTNVHQLRELIRDRLSDSSGRRLSLLFQSFGFKNAVPRDADFVFDVRCLPNPHWHAELRPLTGLDPEVASFLEEAPDVRDFRQDIASFLERWIPLFESEGRNYLTVAIGCTGGQHRSVYMVRYLANRFREAGQRVLVRHRELS